MIQYSSQLHTMIKMILKLDLLKFKIGIKFDIGQKKPHEDWVTLIVMELIRSC